jgi:Mg-chelatase subunit ChlD
MSDVLEKRITRRSPMHIVLVADDSLSMKGPSADAATEAMHAWVNELHIKTRGKMPYFRFSLVMFGSKATTLAEGLDVRDVDIEGFRLAGTSGTTNVAAALHQVQEILLRDGATGEWCPPFVFVFTDGKPTDGQGHPTDAAEQAALDEAARLKLLALPCGAPFLITLGFGEAKDDFLRKLASKPSLYHRLPNAQALIKLLPSIGTPTVEAAGTIAGFVEQIEKAHTGIQDR